jgi:hypothetical protein
MRDENPRVRTASHDRPQQGLREGVIPLSPHFQIVLLFIRDENPWVRTESHDRPQQGLCEEVIPLSPQKGNLSRRRSILFRNG